MFFNHAHQSIFTACTCNTHAEHLQSSRALLALLAPSLPAPSLPRATVSSEAALADVLGSQQRDSRAS